MQLKSTTIAVIGVLIAGFVSGAFSMPGGNIVEAATKTIQTANSLVEAVSEAGKDTDQATANARQVAAAEAAQASKAEAEKQAPAAQTNNSQPSQTPVLSNSPGRIGIYITDSPSDPTSLGRLDEVAALGVDTVYNYTILDGSEAQIRSYLDRAQSRNIKVIFSLKDLYDQLEVSNYRDLYSSPLGANNEETALNAVRIFGPHPAVWGFATSDEAPEAPSSLASWQPILQQRYNRIKQLTTKPVMLVLVGATSPSAAERQQFLRALRSSTDTFALDYYPIPFQSTAMITAIAQDLIAAQDYNGWFVAQDFSWSSYPDTARGLGFNVGASRFPTTQEMVSMATLALNGGAKNILFYSYFDIRGNPTQVAALKAAIIQLRR